MPNLLETRDQRYLARLVDVAHLHHGRGAFEVSLKEKLQACDGGNGSIKPLVTALVVVNTRYHNQLRGVNKTMKSEKKAQAPAAAAETTPAVGITVKDTAKPKEIVAEAPATAPKAEKKVKEEKVKGKDKGKKDKKNKKK